MSLADRWTAHLQALHEQGRYRTLAAPAGIDFSSNDYLGYRSRFRVQEVTSATERSATASRLLRGHHHIWDEIESQLAAWHGAEAALMMTSGYMANEGLLSTIIEEGDWVASDQLNHASIIDGLRLSRARKHIYRHNDLDHLADGLQTAHRNRTATQQLFIVTESLFGMEGDCAPLEQIAELAEEHDAHLIVDEAHATGCLGPEGSGLVNALGLRHRVLATVHTGGKALALPGAYVCGSTRLRELLINRCRHFIFTTALAPIIGEWWLQTLPRVRSDEPARARLRDNAALFHSELKAHGVVTTTPYYIFPLVLGADDLATRAASLVQEQGYDIRAIRPPTVPEGTARLRVSIHADHEKSVLQAVARVLATPLFSRESPPSAGRLISLHGSGPRSPEARG